MQKERRDRIENILQGLGLKALNTVRIKREVEDEGVWFFHILGETDTGEKRFVKILADTDNEEARRIIVREAIVHRFLSDAPVGRPQRMNIRKLLGSKFDLDKGEAYTVVEAFPETATIGFIKSEKEIEKLEPRHARTFLESLKAMSMRLDANELVDAIKQEFHLDSMDDVFEMLEDYYDSFDGYRENTLVVLSMLEPELSEDMDEDEKREQIDRSFENHSSPEDMEELLNSLPLEYEKYLNWENDEFGVMPLWMIMEKRLGAKDFRKSVHELLAKHEPAIRSFQLESYVLVHGDACPANTYFHDDGRAELIDWGHAGLTKNKLLALIHDYGNMRARAWNNPRFRDSLDDDVAEFFREMWRPDAAEAVIALGILRSHMCLAGFFENYDISKQREEAERARRESTEQDVRKAFRISGIEL